MISNPAHVEHVMDMYQRRLVAGRQMCRRYYENHSAALKQRRLITSIRKGRCPRLATVVRNDHDKDAILAAWLEVVGTKTKLTDSARKFHRWLTGSEWSPPSQ